MKRLLSTIYFTCCIALMLTVRVNAYVDPSVATFAVQVVAGAAVAIGAVVGIFWRRAKKKVQDTLGIDENSKKEKEEDIVFDEDL